MEGVGFAIAAAVGFAFFNIWQLGVKDSRIHPFLTLFLNLTGGTVVLVLAMLLTGRYLARDLGVGRECGISPPPVSSPRSPVRQRSYHPFPALGPLVPLASCSRTIFSR